MHTNKKKNIYKCAYVCLFEAFFSADNIDTTKLAYNNNQYFNASAPQQKKRDNNIKSI